jgi:hydroxypyruvate isomerase
MIQGMKISVPDWCFYGRIGEGARYYAALKEIGVDGVEMVAPERHLLARSAGLEILNAAGPGIETGLNRRENHAELLPQIRDSIETAKAGGIPLVIIFSGNRAGQTGRPLRRHFADEEGIASCRAGVEALLPDAQKAAVVLGFEMLNSIDHADYEGDHGSYGFALADAVDSPWLKLVYDVYHMERMGDDSGRDIVRHLDRIAHLHVAESPRRDAPRADGTIRYDRIIRQVTRAGYDRYWGMEFIPGNDALQELRDAISLFHRLSGE